MWRKTLIQSSSLSEIQASLKNTLLIYSKKGEAFNKGASPVYKLFNAIIVSRLCWNNVINTLPYKVNPGSWIKNFRGLLYILMQSPHYSTKHALKHNSILASALEIKYIWGQTSGKMKNAVESKIKEIANVIRKGITNSDMPESDCNRSHSK
jgi:hypothetical protein